MEKTTKSLTVSDLISWLQQIKDNEGDLEVVLASDPEGNSFGTLTETAKNGSPTDSLVVDGEYLIFYPTEQFTELD
jgi:hypothetical protein